MKKILTTIILLSSLTGICQTKAQGLSKLKVGLMYSPDIYLNLNTITTADSKEYPIKDTEFNFTTGIVGQMEINSKLDVTTGLSYSKKDITSLVYCVGCHYIALYFPEPELIKQRYIEIPIGMRYHFVDKKLNVHAEAGLIGSYLIKETDTYSEYPELNSIIKDRYAKNKFFLSGQIGMGTDLNLDQRMNLSFTTVYRNSLSANFSNDPNFKLRSLGFVTELVYQIKHKE